MPHRPVQFLFSVIVAVRYTSLSLYRLLHSAPTHLAYVSYVSIFVCACVASFPSTIVEKNWGGIFRWIERKVNVRPEARVLAKRKSKPSQSARSTATPYPKPIYYLDTSVYVCMRERERETGERRERDRRMEVLPMSVCVHVC